MVKKDNIKTKLLKKEAIQFEGRIIRKKCFYQKKRFFLFVMKMIFLSNGAGKKVFLSKNSLLFRIRHTQKTKRDETSSKREKERKKWRGLRTFT